jgi:death-on-curing protein
LIRYLTLGGVISLHQRLIEQSRGSHGLWDLGALESAVAQPRMTFGGEDLYRSVIEKAVALGFSLIQNHPFVDGNEEHE